MVQGAVTTRSARSRADTSRAWGPGGGRSGGLGSQPAVATAAHDVLVALLPTRRRPCDLKLATSLAAIPDGPAEAGGMEDGAASAAAMLAAEAIDGRFSSFTVIQGGEPGE